MLLQVLCRRRAGLRQNHSQCFRRNGTRRRSRSRTPRGKAQQTRTLQRRAVNQLSSPSQGKRLCGKFCKNRSSRTPLSRSNFCDDDVRLPHHGGWRRQQKVFGKFSRSTMINALIIGLVSGVVFCAGSGTIALLLLCPLFALLGACAVVAATKSSRN